MKLEPFSQISYMCTLHIKHQLSVLLFFVYFVYEYHEPIYPTRSNFLPCVIVLITILQFLQFHKTLLAKHYTQQSAIEHLCAFLRHCPSKCKSHTHQFQRKTLVVMLTSFCDKAQQEARYGPSLFMHQVSTLLFNASYVKYYKMQCMMCFLTETMTILCC